MRSSSSDEFGHHVAHSSTQVITEARKAVNVEVPGDAVGGGFEEHGM
jgi:hypothetical protein